MSQWIPCSERLPEDGVEVQTKIDDWRGPRNEQKMTRSNRLWFIDGGKMYVYYTPTHWRAMEAKA